MGQIRLYDGTLGEKGMIGGAVPLAAHQLRFCIHDSGIERPIAEVATASDIASKLRFYDSGDASIKSCPMVGCVALPSTATRPLLAFHPDGGVVELTGTGVDPDTFGALFARNPRCMSADDTGRLVIGLDVDVKIVRYDLEGNYETLGDSGAGGWPIMTNVGKVACVPLIASFFPGGFYLVARNEHYLVAFRGDNSFVDQTAIGGPGLIGGLLNPWYSLGFDLAVDEEGLAYVGGTRIWAIQGWTCIFVIEPGAHVADWRMWLHKPPDSGTCRIDVDKNRNIVVTTVGGHWVFHINFQVPGYGGGWDGLWRFDTYVEVGANWRCSDVVLDGEGAVYCIMLETGGDARPIVQKRSLVDGSLIWTWSGIVEGLPIVGWTFWGRVTTVYPDRVYLTSNNHVICLRASTGAMLWHYDRNTAGQGSSMPLIRPCAAVRPIQSFL